MNADEYISKREAYMTSTASVDVKMAAIKALDDLYLGARERALKAIQESQPEPIQEGD